MFSEEKLFQVGLKLQDILRAEKNTPVYHHCSYYIFSSLYGFQVRTLFWNKLDEVCNVAALNSPGPSRGDIKALCEGVVSSLGLGSAGLGLRVTSWDAPRW